MAKILLGPTVVGIRGTIAGTTFSENGSGPYMKRWSAPLRRKTTAQANQRIQLGLKAGDWRTLSSANKQDWRDWAEEPEQEQFDEFGQGYFLNGFIWFTKFNLWRESVGLPVRATAPTDLQPAAPTIDQFIVVESDPESNSDVQVQFPSGTFNDDYAITFLSRRPNAGNTTPLPSRFLHTGLVTPTATSFQWGLAAIDHFGDITANTNWILAFHRQSAQGYRSPVSTAQVVAA